MRKRMCPIIIIGVMLLCMMSGCGGGLGNVGDLDIDAAARPLSDYQRYIADLPAAPADAEIIIPGTSYSDCRGYEAQVVELDGVSAITTEENGSISYTFTVQQSGLYNLDMDYYPLKGYGDTIERTLYLDGEIPYDEARSIIFKRRYADIGDKRYSTSGNEYRREQQEVFGWCTSDTQSGYGFIDDPLKLYLEAGEHTLTLEGISEPMALGRLRFYVQEQLPSYQEVLARWQAAGIRQGTGAKTYEAEDAALKSDATLYAVEDRSSCATSPYDASLILLNCIGSNNWKYNGQWIEWTVTVPEDGLYTLSLRVKQDYVSGASAVRRLYINGKVPFAEANELSFPYGLSWQVFTPGDGQDAYRFYLKAGENTVRLEAVTGKLAPVLIQVRETTSNLTALYRRITAIVGSFPDELRDYHLEDTIPDMIPIMQNAFTELRIANVLLERISGNKGEQSSYIDQMLVLLNTMMKDKSVIPEQMATFADRINGLSCGRPLLRRCPF